MSNTLDSATTSNVIRVGQLLLTIPDSHERHQLVKQLTSFFIARRRAFSPAEFAAFCHILASHHVCHLEYMMFLEKETVRLLPEFAPKDLCLLLDSFRIVKLHHHQLLTLVLEKMVDQLQAFSAADVDDTLKVFASMGLLRSFLTQRLASLAFRNLAALTPQQLASIPTSLARLRFISVCDFERALERLSYCATQVPRLHEILFAATLIPIHRVALVNSLLNVLLTTHTDISTHPIPEHLLVGLYVIVYFQITDLYCKVAEHLPKLLSTMEHPSRGIIPVISELITAVKLELPHIPLSVPLTLQEQIKRYDNQLLRRWASSPALNELSDALQLMPGHYRLKFTRNSCGNMYPVQFCNSDHRIIIELETPQDVTSTTLRHRHWASQSYETITISFWEWKQHQSRREKRIELLQRKLQPALVRKGLLRGTTPHSGRTALARATTVLASTFGSVKKQREAPNKYSAHSRIRGNRKTLTS